MKKKILAVCLVLILAITAITGASLAYLQDTDTEDNVFTVGNVKIDLWEDFNENLAELMPTTGKDANGNTINAINKDIYVYNEGKNDAYVRVHIAIPTVLDSGDPDFDASANVLHWNFAKDSVAAGAWNWYSTYDADAYAATESMPGYPRNGGDWNFYTATINGVSYNVYVATYMTAIENGANTLSAFDQVYLDAKVTNEDVAKITETLGENWHIYVAAEGVQEQGFADAYTALNTAFGVPGTYTIDWAAAEGVDTVAGN